jgi:hypothetical protein
MIEADRHSQNAANVVVRRRLPSGGYLFTMTTNSNKTTIAGANALRYGAVVLPKDQLRLHAVYPLELELVGPTDTIIRSTKYPRNT